MFAASFAFVAAMLLQDPSATTRARELTLEEALRTALANDLTLQIEEVASETAEYTYRGSWGEYDPVWRTSLSYDNFEREVETNQPPPVPATVDITSETWGFTTGVNYPIPLGGAFDVSLRHQANATTFSSPSPSISDTLALTFTQPLLRGAGIPYGTSIQKENFERLQRQYERVRQARQDLVKRVSDAYWDLVASLEQLKVAQETLALGREQLEQNRRRLAAGVGTEVEVLQADTNVAQRIEQELARQVAWRNAADRLKGLMYPGTDPATWELALEPVSSLPDIAASGIPTWAAALQVALDRRPELRAQQFEIEAAQESHDRAMSDSRSLLDFVVGASNSALDGGEGDALRDATSYSHFQDQPAYSASFTFNLPIGNRTRDFAERSARAAVRSARLVYDQIESQIVEEVRTAVRNAQYSIEAVRAAGASTELARRQLAAEQARYREGLSTNFQVLQFQQQLAETLYSQTLARANLAKAATALERAQGTLDGPKP